MFWRQAQRVIFQPLCISIKLQYSAEVLVKSFVSLTIAIQLQLHYHNIIIYYSCSCVALLCFSLFVGLLLPTCVGLVVWLVLCIYFIKLSVLLKITVWLNIHRQCDLSCQFFLSTTLYCVYITYVSWGVNKQLVYWTQSIFGTACLGRAQCLLLPKCVQHFANNGRPVNFKYRYLTICSLTSSIGEVVDVS